ncbi:hypothetical protein OUZ56_009970 [Daphnia magna]|uniref:Uncharacterized protein n=1 Tax=Daphnia magna TaxID=35525 RepID=A0ABR0AHK9_9CRUS|nr:hypothetical protein OUZ56_009970 [Daphnia magna]
MLKNTLNRTMHLRRSTQTLIYWCASSRINEMFDINSQPKENWLMEVPLLRHWIKVVLVVDTDHQSIHAMADFEGSQNLRVGKYSFAVDTNYSEAVEIVFGLIAVGHFDLARMNKICSEINSCLHSASKSLASSGIRRLIFGSRKFLLYFGWSSTTVLLLYSRALVFRRIGCLVLTRKLCSFLPASWNLAMIADLQSSYSSSSPCSDTYSSCQSRASPLSLSEKKLYLYSNSTNSFQLRINAALGVLISDSGFVISWVFKFGFSGGEVSLQYNQTKKHGTTLNIVANNTAFIQNCKWHIGCGLDGGGVWSLGHVGVALVYTLRTLNVRADLPSSVKHF